MTDSPFDSTLQWWLLAVTNMQMLAGNHCAGSAEETFMPRTTLTWTGVLVAV